jgi:biotin carboxylase
VAPEFAALARVQDTLSAAETLRAVGLRRPAIWVAHDAAELIDGVAGPVFCKAPIGTASTGVRQVHDVGEARVTAACFERAGAFADGGVLVEAAVPGPLLMVQSVFEHGRLLALHFNERTREGAGGGASGKTSRSVPGLAEDVAALGAYLGWHGALSADAILAADGPVWIDVNPRLVEPVNAARAGVDLLGPLLALAAGDTVPRSVIGGQPEVRTHQLLLATLGAAPPGKGAAGCAGNCWAPRPTAVPTPAAARNSRRCRPTRSPLCP